MSLDQLRYFVAVAETGSTHAASVRSCVSQPPLSRQIRALEAEVGVPLFQRTSRGMQLRPAGVTFLQHARSILGAVDAAVVAARGHTGHVAAGSALEWTEAPPADGPG